MTYRIDQSTQCGASVFALSGVLGTEHAAGLQEQLATAVDAHIVLDLRDITLVDRAGVRFLAHVQRAGAEIVNCPEYVRIWMLAESFPALTSGTHVTRP